MAYGHTNHRENRAYSLQEIKQFLVDYPSGQIAVAIRVNAFLALRKPELEALLPDDFDGDSVRITATRGWATMNACRDRAAEAPAS